MSNLLPLFLLSLLSATGVLSMDYFNFFNNRPVPEICHTVYCARCPEGTCPSRMRGPCCPDMDTCRPGGCCGDHCYSSYDCKSFGGCGRCQWTWYYWGGTLRWAKTCGGWLPKIPHPSDNGFGK